MKENSAKIIQFESFKKRTGSRKAPPISENSVFGRGLSDKTMQRLTRRFSNPISEMDFRNQAIFLLMSTTGLRAAEVVSLRFSNLLKSPQGEILVKYRKKGGRVAYSVISKKTIKSIREYHRECGISGDYFFYSRPRRHQTSRSPLSKRGLQMIVSSWNVKTLEGRNIFCHSIRHTSGRRMLEKAGSIATQKLLGHSSPTTSSRFYTLPFYDGSKFLNWE